MLQTCSGWCTHIQLAAPGIVVHINGRLWPALDLGLQQNGVVYAPLPLAVRVCRCMLPHTGLASSKAVRDALACTSLSFCSIPLHLFQICMEVLQATSNVTHQAPSMTPNLLRPYYVSSQLYARTWTSCYAAAGACTMV